MKIALLAAESAAPCRRDRRRTRTSTQRTRIFQRRFDSLEHVVACGASARRPSAGGAARRGDAPLLICFFDNLPSGICAPHARRQTAAARHRAAADLFGVETHLEHVLGHRLDVADRRHWPPAASSANGRDGELPARAQPRAYRASPRCRAGHDRLSASARERSVARARTTTSTTTTSTTTTSATTTSTTTTSTTTTSDRRHL